MTKNISNVKRFPLLALYIMQRLMLALEAAQITTMTQQMLKTLLTR